MGFEFRRKFGLTTLLAANLAIAQEPLPSDLNLCLDAWHLSDKELGVCKSEVENYKSLSTAALYQRDRALSMAAKEEDPNFLGIPPLAWGCIGFLAGGAATYAAFHK